MFSSTVSPPCGDWNERSHHADERALACAIRAKQPKDFAIRDLEGYALDRLEVPVALHDIFDSDDRICFHFVTSLSFGT
jgi:hypothetical protein